MVNQLSWKVGGQQGEGIESTGEIFSVALNRQGYFIYAYRHFSSRIKGGHTNNKVRVSVESLQSISDDLDILVAFDQETIDFSFHELREGGVLIADMKFNLKVPDGKNIRYIPVPITEIAENLGTSLMKNMVSIGATIAILDLPINYFHDVVEELFAKKGQEVVNKNMEAIVKGFEYVRTLINIDDLNDFRLERPDGKRRLYMIANDAVALGALAAGCRFMPAYPITPASEVMEYLIKKLPKYGGTVIQTEDEIAAITMAIGASFAGARSMTATSGPGLSLMMEAIGLSGMTEVPVVIVDAQRGGPSTGLPTKHETSDFNAAIYGTHGEIPKIVIAPSTTEEAFYDTIEAFNLADKYQCPVIILTDLVMGLNKQTVEPFDYNKIKIDRGAYLGDQELPEIGGLFKRYEFTETGISPRVIPGQKFGLHHVTGVEHDVTGRPSEKKDVRAKMVEKRLMKINNVEFSNPVFIDAPYEHADVLLVGVNSTRGTISEAKNRLIQQGLKVNHAHIRLIHPFPKSEMEEIMNRAEKVIVIENNATAQIAKQIILNVGMRDKIKSVLKYDGNPFLPGEIYNRVKELI